MNNTTEPQTPLASTATVQAPLLQFRPDIEGLRALAILMVVACHAGFTGFAGGFSGVDVFFVLSGFLISGLLITEYQRCGRIQMLNFYARRLQRLLPALLLMTTVMMVAAAVLLAPIEQRVQARTMEAVPLWMSNFHFSFSLQGYFSAGTKSNLFLHTWSLAVEEQFYLVWPPLVLFLCGAFGKARKPLASKRLSGLVIGIMVSGFLLNLCLSFAKPLWAFYLMPGRVWQFALGALVFVLTSSDTHSVFSIGTTQHKANLPVLVYSVCGGIGLTLLVLGTVLLSESMLYPGYAALLPSIGTALLLFAGAATHTSTLTRILSLPPMQTLGKLSYSWYLWHWPVLVLGNTLLPEGGVLQNLVLVLLALLLAFLSFHIVEAPVRHNRTLALRPVLTVSLSLVLMSSSFMLAKIWQQKADAWAALPGQTIHQLANDDSPKIYSMACDEWYRSARVVPCSFGDPASSRIAVLWGDSVGAQWFTALAQPLVEQGWFFLVLTKSACPIVDEPVFYARIGMEYTVCSDWRAAALDFIARVKPDIIFMGSADSYDFSHDQWLQGTRRILEKLSPATDQIYLLQAGYQLPFDGPYCLARRDWQPAFLSGLSDCTAVGMDASDTGVAEALKQASMEFANIRLLNFNPLICPERRCAAQIEEQIVYRDFQHLTNSYVETLTPQIQALLDPRLFAAPDTAAE